MPEIVAVTDLQEGDYVRRTLLDQEGVAHGNIYRVHTIAPNRDATAWVVCLHVDERREVTLFHEWFVTRLTYEEVRRDHVDHPSPQCKQWGPITPEWPPGPDWKARK